MHEKFTKPYNPQETEPRIYKLWEESGLFNPDVAIEKGYAKPDAPVFSMVMPPPNVTGVLHMGHAMMLTVEDIMVRYKRMQGYRTLWLPGTDHAAIATQSKVEKIIQKEEGKNRHDLGREELLKRVKAFAQESHDTIVNQVRIMGSSTDWSREAFTLDEVRTKAVRTIFKSMYEDGLVYRGQRIVNWDPKGQTTISDDEIVYTEQKTTWYTFKYGPFEIGTTRPETKFGDKYVVMHPDDKRYSQYKDGDTFELEWINGKIKAVVVKDKAMDMTFGTGVMTITPWHSVVDFDIAERHGLDREQIIDKYGKMLANTGEFAGKKIAEARSLIVEKLRRKGLLLKEEPYVNNIATAERTGGIIEPQIMLQWFIDVNKPFVVKDSRIKGITSGAETTLKDIMRLTVEKEQIRIIPDHFTKTYFHWIENLRDWCISRQIWYGHRIPVWYCEQGQTMDNLQEDSLCYKPIVSVEDPVNCPHCLGVVNQDEDTLDTWFSSGLWTFSTLGWPEKTKDFETYHPTDVLETGYGILFFWVARMILMTGYALGDIPFHTVYLHGTVRDDKGRTMSKSLGNGIDPIDVAKKFGADAGRISLVIGSTPGTDSRIFEDKIKGYKHFANKLWNITRFVETNAPATENGTITTEKDRATVKELEVIVKEITADMEKYNYHLVAEKLYHYIWHTFADILIEEAKPRLQSTDVGEKASAQAMLRHVLETSLKLLHPFMPFVTEEIWQTLNEGKTLLMVEAWPTYRQQ